VTGRRVFTRIARRYDRVNRILSLGRDSEWRRSAIASLPEGRVLDLGAGTGAASPDMGGREVVALDPARQMLALDPEPRRVVAVGERLPFQDGSFDGVFSAFVVRNLESLDGTLAEVARVLRPGGVVAFVDLGRPESAWKRVLHRIGTAMLLPLVGLLFARAPGEYWYLHRSLDSLPQPDDLYADAPLQVERIWRMGPLGFVYGVVMRKEGPR
jgi:demethylmenaquinone methyltransferase/2-methoxy-6-polyprenyl-1,4-benzoquinol methylase